MPLGKYYCDYCDKEFQDTPQSRRRHLNGVAHQRAKALWYDACRSSSQLELDQIDDFKSTGKGVCNRFVSTGSCKYGQSCKYYHPKTMNAQRIEGASAANNAQSGVIPGGLLNGGATLPAVFSANQMGMSLGNLPPSLLPPPEGGYAPLPFVDWG